MALLPDRHPQKDFFILDIADVVLKDDMASMEHPLFSLATKPDHRHLEYRGGGNRLKIIPSGVGLPTIFDKDILIFCISQLMHKKNRGEPIGNRVRFSGRELLMATNRPTNNLGYQQLSPTISNDYFRLRRPLERRIYEIARKHCGSQKRWHINLAKLQDKTGSNAPLKKFRLNIRQIIEGDHLPFYTLELTTDDLVIFRPRQNRMTIAADIVLPEWAEEKARETAREKGWDYHALRANWMNFAQAETAKGNPPKSAGAAFVSYCKKRENLR